MTHPGQNIQSVTVQPSSGISYLTTEFLSEGFWFTAAFVLFLLLGPFSAPVVVIALYKLAKSHQGNQREPKQVQTTKNTQSSLLNG